MRRLNLKYTQKKFHSIKEHVEKRHLQQILLTTLHILPTASRNAIRPLSNNAKIGETLLLCLLVMFSFASAINFVGGENIDFLTVNKNQTMANQIPALTILQTSPSETPKPIPNIAQENNSQNKKLNPFNYPTTVSPQENVNPTTPPTPSASPEPTPTAIPIQQPLPMIINTPTPLPTLTPPTATPTPNPTPTPTPTPTSTPIPTPNPTPTPTPTPKPTTTPTPTPTPTSTPKPTPNPTPTPTPTPKPTITPTPTPTSTPRPLTNLATIPWSWPDYQGNIIFGTGTQIAFLDQSITYNGNPSIRLQKHTTADINVNREVNCKGYSVKPGDHIIAKVWAKTDSIKYVGEDVDFKGSRLGLDFYAPNGNGASVIVDGYPHAGAEVASSSVSWGTTTWTHITWDIIVPSTIYTKAMDGTPLSESTKITGMIMWLQAIPVTFQGIAWFANAELYINP